MDTQDGRIVIKDSHQGAETTMAERTGQSGEVGRPDSTPTSPGSTAPICKDSGGAMCTCAFVDAWDPYSIQPYQPTHPILLGWLGEFLPVRMASGTQKAYSVLWNMETESIVAVQWHFHAPISSGALLRARYLCCPCHKI